MWQVDFPRLGEQSELTKGKSEIKKNKKAQLARPPKSTDN